MAKKINPKSPKVGEDYITVSYNKGEVAIRVKRDGATKFLLVGISKPEMDAIVIEYNKIKHHL